MRSPLPFLIIGGAFVLLVVGCYRTGVVSVVDDRFKPAAIQEARDSLRIIEMHHPDGSVAARGLGLPGLTVFDPRWSAIPDYCANSSYCVLSYYNNIDSLAIRSGRWQYWYPNGQTQAILNFRLDVDVFCGAVPFFAVYDVKVDSFAFFHPNGVLLTKGHFVPSQMRRENNCEGGTILDAGAVRLETLIFDSTAHVITDKSTREELREMIELW